MEKELEQEFAEAERINFLERYIYAYYPPQKQAQDEKWVSSFSTKLKAEGVEELEAKVVQFVARFLEGETLDEILKEIEIGQREKFKKLIKVAIRTEWAERCINEYDLSIAENRESEYPDFIRV